MQLLTKVFSIFSTLTVLAELSLGDSRCRSGFFYDYNSQMCYLVASGHATFDNAVLNCRLYGASLPIIHNQNVQNAITVIQENADPDYLWYVGLRRVSGQVFEWINQDNVDYQNWMIGQPMGSNQGMDCVANFQQNVSFLETFGWRVAPCSDTLPYICTYQPDHIDTTTATTTQVLTSGATTTYDPMTCGPSYLDGSGTIVSPGFSIQQDYPENSRCVYHFQGEAGKHVLLSVNSFTTESCCDFFHIYDGADTNSQSLAKWSGIKAAGTKVESSGQKLTARFTSDNSIGLSGYSIQYTVTSSTLPPPTTRPPPACPRSNYTASSGVISSPEFPSTYYNSQECNYYITVAPNMAVQLTFNLFHTEEEYDLVTIYDGTGFLAQQLAVLNGYVASGTSFTSSGNVMYIHFSSDVSNTDIGFNASYTSVTPPTTTTERPTTRYPETPASQECGADFAYDSQSEICYHYDYQRLDYNSAVNACANLSATLASIHSQAAEDYIAGYIQQSTAGYDRFYTWIGLQAVHSQFSRWQDGTPIDYTVWEAGQPNLSAGQCGSMQAWDQQGKGSGWRSLSCSYIRPYLCMRPELKKIDAQWLDKVNNIKTANNKDSSESHKFLDLQMALLKNKMEAAKDKATN